MTSRAIAFVCLAVMNAPAYCGVSEPHRSEPDATLRAVRRRGSAGPVVEEGLDRIALAGYQQEYVQVSSRKTGGWSSGGLVTAFGCPQAPAAAAKALPQSSTYNVGASGAGDYDFIRRAPAGATTSIAPGTCRERLKITRPNIRPRGSGPDARKTVIVFDASAVENSRTLHSATVEMTGDGFTPENLTFANDFDAHHPQLPQGSQASALMVTAGHAVFRDMRFLGNQDTLCAGTPRCTPSGDRRCETARQYLVDAFIERNVNFIFGNGKAVFEGCEIQSTAHGPGVYIAAQSRNAPDEDRIYGFDHCSLTAAPGAAHVSFGGPWKPYAAVVYRNTEMGARIEPSGLHEWHAGQTHSQEAAFDAKYHSSGPGAHPAEREPYSRQPTTQEAARYDPRHVLAGADRWDALAK